jgi:S1-C subfamily serine protease
MGSPATDAELRARDLDPANIALKVSSVIPGMNGDLAGILPGDLVTEIDGSALEDTGDGYFTLFDIVGGDPPEVFELTIVRQNSATTLRVRRD